MRYGHMAWGDCTEHFDFYAIMMHSFMVRWADNGECICFGPGFNFLLKEHMAQKFKEYLADIGIQNVFGQGFVPPPEQP